MFLENTKEKNKLSKLVIICMILTLVSYVFINFINRNEVYAVTQTREKYSESKISTYPGYKELITSLKNSHPNWNFIILYTGLDWNQVIKSETVARHGRSVVPESWSSVWKCAECGETPYGGSSWRCASEAAVAYYMDPRNWLNDEYIFQFENLAFSESTQTVEGVKKIISDMHYMDGDKATYTNTAGQTVTLNKSYAQIIYDAAKEAGISPYHLASRIRQEQGAGNNPGSTATGTYRGYVGYYNYLNVCASGSGDSDVTVAALQYAKDNGWTDPEKSIKAGAKEVLADDYINDGQDTLYLQKYDVDNSDNTLYTWQYMQNIAAAVSESTSVRDTYRNLGIFDTPRDFVIPVFENMPSSASPQPGTSSSNASQTTVTGEKVQVICPSGLLVRMEPGTGKGVLTAVNSGTILTRTKAGVSNADGYTWDEVVTSSGLKGYVARGDSTEAYIKVVSDTSNISTLKTEKVDFSKGETKGTTGSKSSLINSFVYFESSGTVSTLTKSYSNATVTDANGKAVTSGNIGTGYKVNIGDKSYTAIKLGDVTGDGAIDSADFLRMKKVLLGLTKVEGVYASSLDVTNDGSVDSADFLRMKKYLLKLKDINF